MIFNRAEPVAWHLHQASLAIFQGDPASALGWVERARSENDEARSHTEVALPELRALARAQKLAEAVRFTQQQLAVAPGLLSGFVACLEREEVGLVLRKHVIVALTNDFLV